MFVYVRAVLWSNPAEGNRVCIYTLMNTLYFCIIKCERKEKEAIRGHDLYVCVNTRFGKSGYVMVVCACEKQVSTRK